jgi:glycosyltransferase involved in cell wall biosynthesis
MKTPLVSIITPTYNHETFIADCIQSVLRQTYPHWEMIIVDDGSSDQTLKVAQSFAAGDSRIRIYTQQNVGIYRLNETYNYAVSVSTGSFLAVLEGDDVWSENKLELQVKAMEEQPKAVLCWGMAYSSKADLSGDYQLYPLNDKGAGAYINTPLYEATRHLIMGCYIPALTVMVRRSALERVGGFVQPHNLPLVDLPTWQLLSLEGSFVYIPEVLGRWRIYPHQITKTLTTEMTVGFLKLAKDLYKKCKPLGIFSDTDYQKIVRHYKKSHIISFSRSGRYKLIRKDFQGAREDYVKSLFSFGFYEPVWKLRSLVGLVFSLFKTDIEGLAKKLGKVSYK